MKKKGIMIITLITLMGGAAWFFLQGPIDSLATTTSAYNIEEGVAAGDVVQQNNEVLNLMRLEQFYKNVRSEIEDTITIAIVNANQKVDLYELKYVNGQLKLYYDVTEDVQGRKEYKIKLYTSMKKILKKNQVIYKLVNDQEERSFLSYNLN